MIIDYDIINKLAADLDIKVLHSQLIASNVANVDTPGCRAKDLKFRRILADSMGEGDPAIKRTYVKHLTSMETPTGTLAEIEEDPNPGRPDGNNVNFSSFLKNAIDEVNQDQLQAEQSMKNYLAGKGPNLHNTLLSLEKADLSFILMIQVRQKLLDAYQQLCGQRFKGQSSKP